MKKLKRTYLRSGRVIGAVLLLLMIVGSIWDLPISKFLYPGRESSFGQFFAAFGELPAFLAMTSAGVLLFFNRKRLRKSWNVLFLAAAAVLVAGGIVLSIHEARDNVPAMPLWVAALVTVFAAALAGFLLLLGTEGCQTKTILRFILVLAFISIGMMIVINVIKIPWGRPRMRLLLSTGNESYFQPWWKLGGSLKAKLIAEGVASDEFRSFPSGHTGCAACAMLAILLPTVCKRLRGKERLCLIIGAAWTAVDLAEEPEKAEKVRAINVGGTQNMADACKKLGCKMTYISTDYVFDGQGTEPWQPDCRDYRPLNVYGQTKLEGELAVSRTLEKYFIVRIAWVFGLNGKNFIKTMLNVGKTHDAVRVVNDQIGTPTYTYDLAQLLIDMNETEKYGYYHATNEGGYISWYDFTKEIYRQAGYATQVVPVTTAEYGLSRAARPFNSRLDKRKLVEAGFTPLPTWQDALSRYLKEIEK